MSPLLVTLLILAALYIVGREVEHYGRHIQGRVLNPSRCEYFADDVEFDSWAELWESAYAEDELERWARLAPFDPEARA